MTRRQSPRRGSGQHNGNNEHTVRLRANSGGGGGVSNGGHGDSFARRNDSGGQPTSENFDTVHDLHRQLGEKDAHLKMLRSRLETVERDSESYKRQLAANSAEREREHERERNAMAAGGDTRFDTGFRGDGGFNNGPSASFNATKTDQRNPVNRSNFGPNPMEISNAAALAEARAELARIKSRVAFKDEEAEEARRREDEHRVLLQRSEQETMRLAAEVRKERRRAAAAEAEASGTGGGQNIVKRKAGEFDVTTTGDLGTSNPGTGSGSSQLLPQLPPTPPVTLVLPPAPKAVVGEAKRTSADPQSSGAKAFAAVTALTPHSVQTLLRVESSAVNLRLVLSDVASNVTSPVNFVCAARQLLRNAADSVKAGKRIHQIHAETTIITDTVHVLAAFVQADETAEAAALTACGASGTDKNRESGVSTAGGSHQSNGASVAIAPRPPPEPLGGIPAAGTDGVGVLVPHPGALGCGSRVFVSAPESFSIQTEFNSIGAKEVGVVGSNNPSAETTLLSDLLVVVTDALDVRDWSLCAACLSLLKHLAARASPLNGRGAFISVITSGVLEQTLVGRAISHKSSAISMVWNGTAGTGLNVVTDTSVSSTLSVLTQKHKNRGGHGAHTNASDPPLSVQTDALVLVGLLAVTPAFLSALESRDGIDNINIETTGDDSTCDSPLLSAVVRCTEDTCGVGGGGKPFDASLTALSAISHVGWSGWGDAVKRHGVLSCAVLCAESAFVWERDVTSGDSTKSANDRRVRLSLMFVARLLAEPISARAATSALRRDGETSRRLARVARYANAHAEQMPKRVGKYLDSVLEAWS